MANWSQKLKGVTALLPFAMPILHLKMATVRFDVNTAVGTYIRVPRLKNFEFWLELVLRDRDLAML